MGDPLAAEVRASHPYARFIQEGNVIGADYNIGRAYSFITANVNNGHLLPFLKLLSPGSIIFDTFISWQTID